jgi:hypothetical protein
MVPISMPMKTMGMVLKKELLPNDPSRMKAIKKTANISGGPNSIAKLARTGARSIRPAILRVPPTQDPHPDIKRAAPPRPFRVIWYPSIQVTIEADSPGMFIRMEVVEPPYMAP